MRIVTLVTRRTKKNETTGSDDATDVAISFKIYTNVGVEDGWGFEASRPRDSHRLRDIDFAC